MEKINALHAFENHVPPNAVSYCLDLYLSGQFALNIKSPRQSKLGDYRYDPNKGTHRISVNHNLNPYAFLITYIHEVAHYQVRVDYRKRVAPHGNEWKRTFARLMAPMMTDLIFPQSVLTPLIAHMRNPKASTHADPHLLQALRAYDQENNGLTLAQVPIDGCFSFRSRAYQKIGPVKRTRSVCLELQTQKRYLISLQAEVEALVNQ